MDLTLKGTSLLLAFLRKEKKANPLIYRGNTESSGTQLPKIQEEGS
jgi:hypothetical protein